MSTFTLAQVREKVRERADMQNSTFVTDSELTGYINSSYAELYDLIIDRHGEDYYISFQDFAAGSGQSEFSLPGDFYKLRGVDLDPNTGQTITLKRFQFQERNRFNNLNVIFDGEARYSLRGNNLVLIPALNSTRNVRLWYVPKPIELISNNDTLDGINGWEEYVVVDAAIKCRVKEESDIQELLIAKQSLEMRINKMADSRDANEPVRITDTERTNNLFNFR
jgi:hypothetical protein